MVVKVHFVVFRVTSPCILIGANQCFTGINCLHFLGTLVQYIETGLDIT